MARMRFSLQNNITFMVELGAHSEIKVMIKKNEKKGLIFFYMYDLI